MFPSLRSILQSEFAIAALTLVSVAFILTLLSRLRARIRSHRTRRRSSRAFAGERRAKKLLERSGYRVLESQLRERYPLKVDGSRHTIEVRADYLVARGRQRFIAEVKTGAQAPSLDHAPTRRQLLEYATVFDVDGVLLVDAEAARVLPIVFPRHGRRPTWSRAFVMAALAVVLSALAQRHVAELRDLPSRILSP